MTLTTTSELAGKILEIAEAIRIGEIDPLELELTEAYQELRQLASKIEERVNIDEMLNEILGAKIMCVEELARILAAPELYANIVKNTAPRKLAKMMVYRHPVAIGHLDHGPMLRSMERLMEFIDQLTKVPPEERIPEQQPLDEDYAFGTEDAVFLEDLELFAAALPEGEMISLEEALETESIDEFLRRFLYIVVLISRGDVEYFSESKEIMKVANVLLPSSASV